MSYIYKITNVVNGKMYVGNTSYDIQKRWKEHCHDSHKARCKDRPLYAAMNEYGLENFEIAVIEKCNDDISCEREQFWIDRLHTFENGYNNTMGGIGKPQIDYDVVKMTYLKTKSQRETAKILNIHTDSVSKILGKQNVQKYSSADIANPRRRQVDVYTEDNKLIRHFESIANAAKWLCEINGRTDNETVGRNIQRGCCGKLKRAYGYIWKYA